MFNPASVVEWALAYVARGWPVFPLHTPDNSGVCSCQQRETCANTGKHPRTPHGFRDATTDEAQVRRWWDEWPEANIGIVTGASSGLVVLDVDPRHGGDATLRQLIAQYGELPKHLWVRTGGGGWHIFFAHPGERIGNLQQSRKLGAGLDVRGDGGYIVAPPSLHQSGARYHWGTDFRSEAPSLVEWLLARLTRRQSLSEPHSRTCFPSDKLRIITEGLRNVTLTSLAGSLRRRGMSEEAIFAALRVENERCCQPPLPEKEVRSIARSIARYQPEQFNFGLQMTEAVEQNRAPAGSPLAHSPEIEINITPWPAAPADEAFYGLAGDIVRLIEPHSEADPVALLAQTLVAFGSTAGRNAHFVAEDDRHYLNLFAVMVGATSKGRKGTSWSRIRSLFESVDEVWTLERVQSGLSSGEGLIWAVRDPVERREPIREKGVTKDYQTVTVDQGVSDKRLLAMESEFASCLRVLGREGNTLSALIRQAWDTGTLRVLTRNSPAKATDAHISIIGHITRDEIRRYLDTTEAANGFANRFLWFCVRRSKALPEGGGRVNFGEITARLHAALRCARQSGEIKRDETARHLWRKTYPELSDGKPGLLGAVISRAEAQVMRLACLYALLDCSPEVRRVHLAAALAIWRYCEDSVRFIFGDSFGDPVADEILRAMKEAGASGLTQTQLNDLFSGNRSSGALARSLTSLAEAGRVICRREETGQRGRPVRRWFVAAAMTEKTDKKEKIPAAPDYSVLSVSSVAPDPEISLSLESDPNAAAIPQKEFTASPTIAASNADEIEEFII